MTASHSSPLPLSGDDPKLNSRPVVDETLESRVPQAFRMNSIERFHLFDDEPEYPNQIFGRLSFSEEIDEAHARQAWNLAIAPHPFSQLEAAKTSQGWQWKPASPKSEHEAASASHFEFVRVERDQAWCVREALKNASTNAYLGVRVFGPPKVDATSDLDQGETTSGSEVWFCVHHAVADGIACLKVVNDWLMIYNNLRMGLASLKGTHPVDPELMNRRGHLGLMRWSYLKFLPLQTIALFGAAKFIFRKTASIDKPPVIPNQSPFPAIVGHWLDESTTDKIYRLAQSHQLSTNAILLGQWFRCLEVWRQDELKGTQEGGQGQRVQDNDWIRVILPMSIRTHADRRMPVANRTAIVQIDRRGSKTEDSIGQFHQMLNREIGIIRGWKLEKMFLIFIRLFSMSNALLKRVASNPTSRGLSVFTDLGRPFAFSIRRLNRIKESGEGSPIIPVDFDLAGPIRRGTPLNVSLSRYQGRLKISLHYDASCFTRLEASDILKEYVNGLMGLECPIPDNSR